MTLPEPEVLVADLLGHEPTAVRALVAWPDRQTHVVEVHGEQIVVKADVDHNRLAREVAAHDHASRVVPVPEILGVVPGAFAMRWVEGVPLYERRSDEAVLDAGRHLRALHELGGAPDDDPPWSVTVGKWLEPELLVCEREHGFDPRQGARIRAELERLQPVLDAAPIVWCHGDCQTEHVLLEPEHRDEVIAFLDFADHEFSDPGWDIAVLTLFDEPLLAPLLHGYEATPELRAHLDSVLPLYRVLRMLGAVGWLAERGHPAADEFLARATAWRPREQPA